MSRPIKFKFIQEFSKVISVVTYGCCKHINTPVIKSKLYILATDSCRLSIILSF